MILNRLTTIGLVYKSNGHEYWRFRCECGEEKIIRLEHVTKGRTKSCGCLRREFPKKTKRFKHGLSRTRFYRIWLGIRSRCKSEPGWAGRGIRCLWGTFEDFAEDMHRSYKEHVEKFGEAETSIDRIDNDGDYCKENCRWAGRKTQMRNTSKSRMLKHKGVERCVSEWAEHLDIKKNVLYRRLQRGWSTEKTVSTPLDASKSH